MQRLRGTFSAVPIERDHTLRPFLDPKLIRKQGRARALVAKGLAPAGDKASQRLAASQAAAEHRITRIPAGKRTRSRQWGD